MVELRATRGRSRSVPGPTIAAVLSPPIELVSFRPRGRLHLGRWIEVACGLGVVWDSFGRKRHFLQLPGN